MPDQTGGSVEIVGSEAAFGQYVVEAKTEIADGQIVPYRADITVVVPNVKTGVANVKRALTAHAQAGVTVDQVESVWDVALGLAFAVSAVNRLSRKSPGEIRQLLQQGRQLRRIMLLSLRSCVEAQIIPEEAENVKAILRGSGAIDAAQDLIDAVATMNKHWDVLKNKVPITPDMLKEGATVGAELLRVLKPAAVPPNAELPPETQEAVTARDRLWTLLLKRHEEWVWKPGAAAYGKAVDQYVPRLQSRVFLKEHDPKAPVTTGDTTSTAISTPGK